MEEDHTSYNRCVDQTRIHVTHTHIKKRNKETDNRQQNTARFALQPAPSSPVSRLSLVSLVLVRGTEKEGLAKCVEEVRLISYS